MNLSEEDKKRFWSKVDKRGENECWNWTEGLFTNGYGQFWLNGKGEKAHRVSLFLEKGEPTITKSFALHTCLKNRKCCNPNHLYYGDHQENMNDKIKDGTQPKGENHSESKLTEVQVREIRQKYIPRKYTQQKLAEEYSVSHILIGKIINSQIWKHVE